jgi:non-homologous end joining protein Ku
MERRMRPVWSGALTFGLVNIPVRLHSAVQSKERVSFRLLHKTDLSPIKYERVCEKEGEAVDWKEIVKGYEYAKGKFVVLTDDDFKAAAIESTIAGENAAVRYEIPACRTPALVVTATTSGANPSPHSGSIIC